MARFFAGAPGCSQAREGRSIAELDGLFGFGDEAQVGDSGVWVGNLLD